MIVLNGMELIQVYSFVIIIIIIIIIIIGTFGMISSSSLSKKTSLVESVMSTRRAIQVTSAIDDSRYNPNVVNTLLSLFYLLFNFF